MDYEKKYNEALERARNLYPSVHEHNKKMLEQVFPELRESEDERIRKAIITYLSNELHNVKQLTPRTNEFEKWITWLSLKFRIGDIIKYKSKQWTIIGIDFDNHCYDLTNDECVDFDTAHYEFELEKQKESSKAIEAVERIDSYITEHTANSWEMDDSNPDKKYYCGVDDTLSNIAGILQGVYAKQKEQKPVEKQDYSGLNDMERAIHRGFLSAGVENVPVTIIKETAKECLAQMKPAEWNDTDMKEARNNLISVCRDWECGKQTTLLPIAAVRARYFLEHLTGPKPAEWSKEDERMLSRCVKSIESSKQFAGSDTFKKAKDKEIDWLKNRFKSIRPQYKQEWSEEDEEMMTDIIESLEYAYPYDNEFRIAWLKSLRPSWKPSEDEESKK